MGLRKNLSPGTTAGSGNSLTTASAGDESSSGSSGNAGSDPAPPEEWAQVGRKNKSAVTRQVGLPQGESSSGGGGGGSSSQMSTIFRGAFKSVVKTNSSKPSATIQPFTMLQLDIHSDSVHTLEAALQLSMTAESIGG